MKPVTVLIEKKKKRGGGGVAIKAKKKAMRESEICDCSCVTLKPKNYVTLSMHAPTFENNILNLHL